LGHFSLVRGPQFPGGRKFSPNPGGGRGRGLFKAKTNGWGGAPWAPFFFQGCGLVFFSRAGGGKKPKSKSRFGLPWAGLPFFHGLFVFRGFSTKKNKKNPGHSAGRAFTVCGGGIDLRVEAVSRKHRAGAHTGGGGGKGGKKCVSIKFSGAPARGVGRIAVRSGFRTRIAGPALCVREGGGEPRILLGRFGIWDGPLLRLPSDNFPRFVGTVS